MSKKTIKKKKSIKKCGLVVTDLDRDIASVSPDSAQVIDKVSATWNDIQKKKMSRTQRYLTYVKRPKRPTSRIGLPKTPRVKKI